MGMNDFGGEPTDIMKLLEGLIENDKFTGRILVITSDGEEPSATSGEPSQHDRFLQLLKDLDISIVAATPSNDLYRDFAEIDSTRRMLILGDEGNE